MRKSLTLLLPLIALPAFAQNVTPAADLLPLTPAQDSAVATPQRKNLTVRQLSAIEFGAFSVEGPGTITVAPSGARIAGGRAALVYSGVTGAAEFEVTGEPGEQIFVMLPVSVNLSRGNGGSAEISNLTMFPTDPVMLDGRGVARIKVGGTLRVGAQMASGSYSGMFDLDVRYAH